LTEEEKVHFRQRSLEHYLACGIAFAGMLAKMCGVDPEELTTIHDTNESSASAVGMACASVSAFASSAGNTTTSSYNNSSSMVYYTQAMSTLRQRISTLAQSISSSTVVLSPEDQEEFTNVQEMLDEIQEAMDSAQETEMGLKIMSEMKANEIKKHEMKMNGEEEEVEKGGGAFGFGDDGRITTTIGFQVPSGLSNGGAVAAATATTTTTTSATAAAAAAPTMLVVKKKKKPLPQAAGDDDSSNKRAKTN